VSIPTSAFQLAFYLALLVPGVVYAAARVRLRGPRAADGSVGARILEAIVASSIFDAIYGIVLADVAAQIIADPVAFAADKPRLALTIFLLGGVVVPYVTAWVAYGDVPMLRRPSSWIRETVRPKLTASQQASDTATAWDFANKSAVAGWVRVRLAEGTWVGGRFDQDSRFSTYPEERDIFLSQQWRLDESGQFLGPVEGSQGVWLAINDGHVVEWLHEEEG